MAAPNRSEVSPAMESSGGNPRFRDTTSGHAQPFEIPSLGPPPAPQPTHDTHPATTQSDRALAEAAAAVLSCAAGRSRVLVGLTGSPGVGKSTFASVLAPRLADLGRSAVIVPMDGFHLSNAALRRLGRSERKGAPDTFDVDGFVALLIRAGEPDAGPVYAPCFHRDLEESIAAEIVIESTHEIVLVDGNYLLLADGAWGLVRPLLDLCIHLKAGDDAARVARLVARHVEHGRSPSDAIEWVNRSDEPNAWLIEAASVRADRVIRL